MCAITALVLSVSVHAAEPPSEPILRIDPGMHTAKIWRISADERGRWLATASEDKTIRVWDLADGKLLSTLRPPIGPGDEGKLNAVAMSPDGTIVAAAGWTQFNQGANALAQDGVSIYLFERTSGRLLRHLPGLPDVILHLAFSPDGRWLAAMLNGNNGVRIFAAANGRLLAQDRDYGGGSGSVHFSGDGRLVTTSSDGLLRLYRFDGRSLTLLAKRATPGGKQPMAARFSPDGQRIAVGFEDAPAVNVLDGNDLSFSYAPDTTGVKHALSSIAWSRDGAVLFAAGKDFLRDGAASFAAGTTWTKAFPNYIRRWSSAGKGSSEDWPVAGNVITDLAALPGGRLAFGSGEPAWGLVDSAGKRQIFHVPMAADFRASDESLKLSRDGAQVRFSYEIFDQSPAIFDSLRRVFLPMDTPNLAVPLLTAPNVTVTDWDGTNHPQFNGVPLPMYPNDISSSLALWPNGDGFVLGSKFTLLSFERSGALRWEQPAPSIVWGVNVSADGRWVVAAYNDGTIRWHRASDGVEQLAFYPHPDKKRWVMWTPTGYYDASPGAEELIGWHVNRYSDDKAAWIFNVIKDSPAMRVGLLSGDLVKEINGKVVSDRDGFIDIVRKTPPNGKLRIKLLRNAKVKLLDVIPSRDNEANEPRIGVQLGSQRTFHESDFFPASRFRERFYRPDVLAKVLEKQDEAEAVRFANEESGRRTQTIVSIAQVLPPVVEIISPASDTSVQSGTIKVRYTVRTAADAPVTAMRVRVRAVANR